MKSIAELLNESRISPKEITTYVNSWLKTPANTKEMYEVLGAIVQGCHDALAYREDPKYLDKYDKNYKDATIPLKRIVDQMK